ncbi:Alpha/Beta hydrolase protein [Phycomyces nitens]|nr:Alpha/Beta hydrolase protein [Phycomyces nitens]
MTQGHNRVYIGVSSLVSFVPALVGLYAVIHQYSTLSEIMFSISFISLGLSVFFFVGYKTVKHGTPVLLRTLKYLNHTLTPIASYLSNSTILGPFFSIVIRLFFFIGFVLLLMSDQLIRVLVGRFVGQHPTKRNLTLINAMHPYFSLFDQHIPHTRSLESSDLFKLRKGMADQTDKEARALTNMLKRPRYSLPLAYTLSVASKLVYEDIEVIKYELKKDGFDVERTFRPIAYRNICAFIVEKDDDIVLVFRGTNPLNIQNYLTNINITLGEVEASWGSMGKVHKGYWDAMGDPAPSSSSSSSSSRSSQDCDPLSARIQIELVNTSIYQTIVSTAKAAVKVSKFFILNLFHHVAEPIDSTWLGHEADIRSHSMYAQAERYIMELIEVGLVVPGGDDAKVPESPNGHTKPEADQAQPSGFRRKKRLFITGHSLGGALATIFLAKMLQSKSPLLEHFSGMYTYGQPKIGDAKFSRIFSTQLTSKIFHHAYNNDVVPRTPSWFHYDTPPGTLVFIDSAYNITLYPPNPYTNEPVPVRPISFIHLSGILNHCVIRRLSSETWIRIIFRFAFPFFLNDHFPSEYCEGLRHGTVNWVIMAAGGIQGGYKEDKRPVNSPRKSFSAVNVQNSVSNINMSPREPAL